VSEHDRHILAFRRLAVLTDIDMKRHVLVRVRPRLPPDVPKLPDKPRPPSRWDRHPTNWELVGIVSLLAVLLVAGVMVL
jgi:hypothetical protein